MPLKITAQNFDDYFKRAEEYLYKKHDYDLAIEMLNRIIEYSPNYLTLFTRGFAYYKRGLESSPNNEDDIVKAISDFDLAIIFNPHYAFSYLSRGMLHYRNFNNTQAIADLEKALQLGLDPEPAQHAKERLAELKS